MKTKKRIIMSCVFMLCSVCMFSQNRPKRDYTMLIAATATETHVESVDLDAVWKDSYKYVIAMPANPKLKTYNKLQTMLLNPEYTKYNTLVFCLGGNLSLTKEACDGRVPVYTFLFLGNKDSGIKFYSIEKLKNADYDYRLIPKEID